MGCFPTLLHGILNPLKMKGSKYHGGSTNHTEKGHFSKRGLNIQWIKIDPLDFTIISPLSPLTGATCNVFAKFLIPMCLFKLNVLGNCSDWKQLVQFSQKECKLCVCLNLVYWGYSIISNFRNKVPIVKKNPLTVHFSIENISTWTNSRIVEEPENPFF
jgi:hypothetical protein